MDSKGYLVYVIIFPSIIFHHLRGNYRREKSLRTFFNNKPRIFPLHYLIRPAASHTLHDFLWNIRDHFIGPLLHRSIFPRTKQNSTLFINIQGCCNRYGFLCHLDDCSERFDEILKPSSSRNGQSFPLQHAFKIVLSSFVFLYSV